MRFETNQKQLLLLLLTVILISFNLRPSMAAIGPLLSSIQKDIPLNFTFASLLTMLPVMAMGLAMFVGLKLGSKLGKHNTISLSLLLISLASLARLWVDSSISLILTAVLSGCGIAFIQAIMPSIIKARFTRNTALYMGFYVTGIMGGATLATSTAPTIAKHFSWQLGLAIWAGLGVAALLCWFSQRHVINHLPNQILASVDKHSSNSRSWLLAIFFGLGTAAYTCVLAWFSPYYEEMGYTPQQSGFLLAYLTVTEVVAGLVFPALANFSQDRRKVLFIVLVLAVIGFIGINLLPTTLTLMWTTLLGLGIGGLFPMTLIITMDHIKDPDRAGNLAGFVQGVGYFIASLSPLAAGFIRDQLNSFSLAWWFICALMVLLMFITLKFNPKNYIHHY
ncbi:cyanate transporter [Pseudomonas sp. F1_0610]|uniref:cyanate transporter n=1 Tax=Pseudomonas sp. F1_0610 TaxID=3114284 RepID=UPI0039C3A6B0